MGWRPAQKLFQSWKILRGDKVMVLSGKDKGLTGTVTQVLRDQNRAVVEGRNLVKKHVRPPPGGDKSQGGIVTLESPLHISKLALLDPATGQPCRVGFRYTEDGSKVRVSRGPAASGQIIPRPDILLQRRKPRATDGSQIGAQDTPLDAAHKKTYDHQAMGEDVGLPPVRLVDGRWQLDVSRMGPLMPFPERVREPWRPKKRGVQSPQHLAASTNKSPGITEDPSSPG